MLQFQHSPKANNGQTQSAIFRYQKANNSFFSTEGNNIMLEFLFEKSCDVKIEQKTAFLSEISQNYAKKKKIWKLCENVQIMRFYAKTVKLCDFA